MLRRRHKSDGAMPPLMVGISLDKALITKAVRTGKLEMPDRCLRVFICYRQYLRRFRFAGGGLRFFHVFLTVGQGRLTWIATKMKIFILYVANGPATHSAF